MDEPIGWLRTVVYDADDHETLSTFWQAVLGVGVERQMEGWLKLRPDKGGVSFAFEPMGQGLTPAEAAEAAASPVRGRPDIEVDDMDVAQARIEALGGRLVTVLHVGPDEEHRRMADPEGNEFTIVLPEPALDADSHAP